MVGVRMNLADAVFRYWAKRGREETMRGYLGISWLGNPCDRALWYGFRWATAPQFEGRMYRLFNRGHREEEIVVQELRGVGLTVMEIDPDTGQQFAVVECEGHMRGHADGVVHGKGLDAVLEIKTHNDRSFKEVLKRGVKATKPAHYVQMMVYARLLGLEQSLYYAVNKNTDDVYSEAFEVDTLFADAQVARGAAVIASDRPLAGISDTPTFHACKWCDHRKVCHEKHAPQPTCRTCKHARPDPGGEWHCGHWGNAIPKEYQFKGCAEHTYIEGLLPDGVAEKAREHGYGSGELYALKGAYHMIGEHTVEALRAEFGAVVEEEK